jgi:hypothetical protein
MNSAAAVIAAEKGTDFFNTHRHYHSLTLESLFSSATFLGPMINGQNRLYAA